LASDLPILLEHAGRCVIKWAALELEVDPQVGGRITRFAFDGIDVLAGPRFHEQYWGSTLWVSPENTWRSPEPSTHDSGRYIVTSRRDLPLTMETAAPSVIGERQIHVAKSFNVDASEGVIAITYSIQNAGDTTIELAPWEVTRLPGGQTSFFPYGSTLRSTNGIRVEVIDGVAWFDHTQHADPEGQKIWIDGTEGWTGHVSGDLLFIKRFPDLTLAESANDETDVEIYSSNSSEDPRAYIELEAQGPLVILGAGEITSWTVRWSLRKIPRGVKTDVGSQELVSLARRV
jgi:hypothetical protein